MLQIQKDTDSLKLDISDLQSPDSNSDGGDDEKEERVLLACGAAFSPTLTLSRDSSGHPIVLGKGAHGCVFEVGCV
jgi:hypothetical protein